MSTKKKAPPADAADLGKQLVELRDSYTAALDRLRSERERRDTAEAQVKETREQFGDLKERLLNAEAALSRLNGYLARVHEDDVVRDGMIEIEDDRGKRMVPRRPPPMRAVHYHEGPAMGNSAFANDYSGKPRTHWTDY